MKLDLAAAFLRRWGEGDGASKLGGHSALRAAGQVRGSEDGVELLWAVVIGLAVAVGVIFLENWYKANKKEAALTEGSSGHEERIAQETSPRASPAQQSAAQSAARSFSSTVFGLGPQRADDANTTPRLSKDLLLQQLGELSNQDLLWILRNVAHSRGPDMLHEALRVPPISRKASLVDSNVIRRISMTEDGPRTSQPTAQIMPQLRFSSLQYYAEEGEELPVRIVRTGDVAQRSVVHYQTRDASAKAGVNYTPMSGGLVFEPGEYEKELQVQIFENEFYGPSLELMVELQEEGLENGCLDKDLSTARVEIMDNDFFPTNAYKDQIDPEKLVKDENMLESLDKTRLLWEYIVFCMEDSTIKWGMVKMMLTDQLDNLSGFVNLIMSVYLVDFVVVSSVPESRLFIGHNREVSLVVVTALLLLPLFGLHYLNYLRQFWGVSGRARTVMQTALLRKFLDYSEDVRSKVRHGDIILATTQDSFVLVEGGLMKTLFFCKQLGAVFMLLLFQFVAPVIFDRPIRIWLVICVCLVPATMAFVAKARISTSTDCLEHQYETSSRLAEMVHETVVCYPLIADYNRRPVFVERFAKLIEKNNMSCKNTECVLANNSYAALWLTTLAVASFTFGGGMLVINGTMTLGMFLANVKIFGDVGDTCQDVYRVWLDMQRVLPPLVRITRLLNLPIDVDERKAVSDVREKLSREKISSVPHADRSETINKMPIIMRDININFHTSAKPIVISGRVEIEPGTMVSVVGPRSTGKSTFLKILGGAILPEPEDFFIASHFTVLHVEPSPIFFSGTLMDNLLFGINGPHDGEARARALRICRQLGMADAVLKMIATAEALPWDSVLSFSQKALLNLARALVANPHILLLHRPIDYMDQEAMGAIMATLREFITKSGLELDEEEFPMALRVPRTVVMTTASLACVELTDQVICISQTDGIRTVAKEEVADLL